MAMLILISLPLGPLCYAYCYQVHCFFPLLFEIIWYLSFSLSSQSPSRTGQGRWCKYLYILLLFVVQSLSQVWLFVTPWTAACQASLSFTISQSLLKFISIESVMPSSHLILCCPLLLLLSIFPSIRVFSNISHLFALGGQSIRVSALASVFPMSTQGWFPLGLTDLISLQSKGLSRNLLQHHNSKASILWHSAFFMV